MVDRAGGYYGEAFKGFRGVTQGEPLFSTILNLVVESVVRHWILWWKEAQEGMMGG